MHSSWMKSHCCSQWLFICSISLYIQIAMAYWHSTKLQTPRSECDARANDILSRDILDHSRLTTMMDETSSVWCDELAAVCLTHTTHSTSSHCESSKKVRSMLCSLSELPESDVFVSSLVRFNFHFSVFACLDCAPEIFVSGSVWTVNLEVHVWWCLHRAAIYIAHKFQSI